jgi:hypothetical protein
MSIARVLSIALLGSALAACGAQTPGAGDSGSPDAGVVAPAPVITARTTDTAPGADAPTAPPQGSNPAPSAEPDTARRPPAELLVKDGVNYACSTDADCAVKDVGNCCGYFPACVNVDSPTFPEKVKAQCAASGMSSVCGFAEIAGCQCVEGRCTDAPGAAGTTLPRT